MSILQHSTVSTFLNLLKQLGEKLNDPYVEISFCFDGSCEVLNVNDERLILCDTLEELEDWIYQTLEIERQ